MKYTILCVGKLKDKFFADAVKEYGKRMSRYGKVEIIEVANEKTPEHAPAALDLLQSICLKKCCRETAILPLLSEVLWDFIPPCWNGRRKQSVFPE